MMNQRALRGLSAVLLLGAVASPLAWAEATRPMVYDVRAFGATGDGKALDSGAINKAIEAAAGNGGGTVLLPAGDYLSVSIRLKSNVALYLDQGATIVAADPKDGHKYDDPEPNASDRYQDFGHTHWHNSLIWGENIENVSILGPGRIWGKGLVRSGGGSRPGGAKPSMKPIEPKPKFGYPAPGDSVEPGWGNKAIALKLCRNVVIRDVSILHGGHFAILATGVDNMTIDNLKIDTNRDGIDLDCCRHVRVSNCSVNSPFDDGICPKSSYALGEARPCEDITITNCAVSGYDEGTLLDGTYKRDYQKYSHHSPTGRIKCGTESNGGFKNITISNCTFDYCRGLALEAVDGALLEDIAITNITMRDITNAPIFIRLGARMRGPEGAAVGVIRRVTISNVTCNNATERQGALISGIPGHPIEDLTISNVRIYSKGGAPKEYATTRPSEQETGYPEPDNFGPLPAYGFFVRHVKNLELSGIELRTEKEDPRPPLVLDDVKGATLLNIRAEHGADVPVMMLRDVEGLDVHRVRGVEDIRKEKVEEGQL